MDDDMSACPDPALWIRVAAGTESPEMGAKLSRHAANCSACATQLREAIHLFAETEDPTEDEFVAQLTSSQPGWHRAMVQKLARPATVELISASLTGPGMRGRA